MGSSDVAIDEGVVLVTYGGYRVDHPRCGGALTEAGYRLSVNPRQGPRGPEEIRELMPGVVAVIADADPFDRDALAAADRLVIIARTGVGIDAIDVEAATEGGIHVSTTPGLNADTVAEHGLALALAVLRQVPDNHSRVKAGGWRDFTQPLGQIRGRTAGIIGFGAIGSAQARLFEACGARVLVHHPRQIDAPYPVVDLDELLGQSDIISVNAPLTEGTHHLIDRERIGKAKPGAIVINTSRGPLIDETALAEALESGHLGGAGLDVFEVEPPAGSRLAELPNVVLSPHIGGASDVTNLEMSLAATESVLAALAGRPVPRAINSPARAHGDRSRRRS